MEENRNPNEYYKKIGFLCGLEIHQRLATKEKLFCSCTATPASKDSKPTAEVLRYQRAVAGELGKVDRSTMFEASRQRAFTYRIFDNHTCLVEIDEEPPHELNAEALHIALSLGRALGCKIADEVEPMRKEVVDGSDPSAFQRTMLIGMDGMLKVGKSGISIPSVFLEEESSGIESGGEGAATYNTDRLGIPLIEIDTDKYIPSPQAAKDAALQIGLLLRLTGKVQRGIGTIRQDVNVSIRGGARVELKGVQDLSFIDRFIENEVLRQQNLIAIKDKLVARKASIGKPADVTDIFKSTESPLLKSHANNGIIIALPLYGFKGMLGFEVNPGMRLGSEISDYAKKAGVKGLIHSDEDMAKYKISEKELDKISGVLKLGSEDAFLMIAGEPGVVENAISLARMRAEYSIKGVPEETRMASDTKLFTSRFQRPLPGGSRMYPETDVRPVYISDAMLKRADEAKPDLEGELKALKASIGDNLALQMVKSAKLSTFKYITGNSSIDAKFAANMLLQQFTELRREGYDVDSISEERLLELANAYAAGEIVKQAVPEVLKKLAANDQSVGAIIKAENLGRISGKALERIVRDASKEIGSDDKKKLVLHIMAKYRLNIDGSELNSIT
ncbi:MAG: Glu-tRNA(Gln) amidotransferase subunit GatE [Candidatus Micrarchaeaceae archaeon]